MSEYDDEQVVDHAFAAFTSDFGSAVHAPGTDDVRHTVIQRRRTRVTTLTVSTGLAIVLPIAAFMGNGRGQPDPGLTTTGANSSAGATSTPTPTNSPSPSPAVTQSPPASPKTPADLGRPISLAQLTAAAVGVPAWPWSGSTEVTCASGRVRLQSSGDVRGSRVGVVELVSADLDEDAAPETAALLRCGYGAEQVVAFDRDDAGEIITLGQVVATTPDMPAILTVGARSRGGVTATVADTRASDGQQRQDRQYAWRGDRFGQVGGPTSFPTKVYPVDLGLTVATPVAGEVSGACEGKLRDVSVAFTVKNHSTHTSGRFYLEWRGGAFLPNGSYEPPYWLDTPGYPAQNGGYRGLKRGESVDLTYKFKIDACVTSWGFTTEVHSGTSDPDPSNNNVTWWLRVK